MIMKPKVAITIRSFDTNTQEYHTLKEFFEITYVNTKGRRLSEEEIIPSIESADAVIAGTEKYSENVLKSTDTLKAISRVGVGLDSIDLKCASDRCVKILNTPNAPTLAVAEHAVALIFALAKNLVYYNKCDSAENKPILGFMVSGRTIGIIGLGRIGYIVAEKLSALGCKIGYYDPYITNKNVPDEWIRYPSIEKLLDASEIITLHMPPAADGMPILNRDRLLHMRKGSFLINTARSSLIDEEALLEAIDSGIIAGAGLDVYDTLIMNEIQKYPMIILTPHVASNTDESRREMETEAIQNLISEFKVN